MSIDFSCPNCKNPIVVADKFAGGAGQCSKCKKSIRVPKRVHRKTATTLSPSLVSARQGPSNTAKIAKTQTKPPPTTESAPPVVKTVLIGSGILLVLAVTIIVGMQYSREWHKRSESAHLRASLDAAILQSESRASSFDFNMAFDALYDFEASLRNSKFLHPKMDNELQTARSTIAGQRRDHDAKIADGWEVFEDRFIAPDEKGRIVAAREEDRIRREQEVRRAAIAKQAAEQNRLATQRQAKRQRQAEENLWRRASDTTGATTLEDVVVLTLAYLQHFPAGVHTTEARGLQNQAVERLWMNRVLDYVDLHHRLYSEIRQNRAITDQALRSPDAWMHVNQLEKIAENNVAYSKQLDGVTASLSSLGAGGFAVADLPTQTSSAITAFCRRNRDEMRYQRWRDARINQAGPQAQLVSVGSVAPESTDSEEAAEWSRAQQAWASLPFLEGTTAVARFLVRFPSGANADVANEQLALGVEMDWSAQVFLALRALHTNRKIAQEYRQLAAELPTTRSAMRIDLAEKEKALPEEDLRSIDHLDALGFVGNIRMKLPHPKSNLTEIVLFFREFRFPGKYAEWAEKRSLQFISTAR